ncbi:MAG: hypothetical protein ACK4SR_08260 [Thiobacillus sp.]
MSLVCWKCGASLAGLPLPLGRRDVCPSCRTDLHVCKQCRHYDAHRAGECRELAAERVADKLRANDCGWFVPRLEAYQGGGAAVARASRSALDALFGGAPARADPPPSADDLFKK